jgi:uncharacterized protein (TIGR04255 family)
MEAVDLDNYFDYRPFLGSRLPQTMASLVMSVTLKFEGERDQCKILLNSALAELSNHQTVILDLDYSSIRPLTVPTEDIDEWIITAHNNIETVFEGCIKDPLRELFQEIK